jgi:hypothetical protein
MLRATALLGYLCFLILWAVAIAVPGGGSNAPSVAPAYLTRWYIGEVFVYFVLIAALLAAASAVVADDQTARKVSKIVDYLLIGSVAFMIYVIVDVAWG